MVYKAVVDWFNDMDGKEEKKGIFIVADTYGEVVEKLVEFFGEKDLLTLSLAVWAPYDGIEFDLDNPDQDWLFHKVDSDIGKTVIWQEFFEVRGLIVYLLLTS